MLTIIAILLLATGLLAAMVGNFTYWGIEADLADKRPDLSRSFNGWYTWSRLREVTRLYKVEFPQGHKVRMFWILTSGGMMTFLAGFVILTNLR